MYYLLTVLLALCIILPVLAAVTVGLRFYARKKRGQAWLLDDWLIFVALICNITLCIVTFWAVFALGLGQPPPTVAPELEEPSWKTLYATIIIEYFTYGTIKVSVILFFKRIFSVGRFVFWAHVLIVLSILWTLAGMIVSFYPPAASFVLADSPCQATACASVPVSLFWQGVFSVNWGALNLSMAAIDMVLDVVILLLPLIAIKELQVTRAQKISIVGLFSLGFICCLSSIMRIYYCYEYLFLGPETTFEWFSYIISSTNLWIITEGNVSIIAACMPVLGGLFRTTRGNNTTKQKSGYIHYGSRSGKFSGSNRGVLKPDDSQVNGDYVELDETLDSNSINCPSNRILVRTEFGHSC